MPELKCITRVADRNHGCQVGSGKGKEVLTSNSLGCTRTNVESGEFVDSEIIQEIAVAVRVVGEREGLVDDLESIVHITGDVIRVIEPSFGIRVFLGDGIVVRGTGRRRSNEGYASHTMARMRVISL